MRPRPLEAVLFDFDGVCADTEPLGLVLDREVCRRFGIAPTEAELETLVGTTGEQTIPALFARHGMRMTAEEYWRVRGNNEVIYRDRPLEPMHGVVGLLRRLRGRGLRTALVSTTRASNINFALNRLGMQTLFDVIVTGDMVERHKPDPEPYQAGLRFLGVEAARAVAIEDSPTGIAAAKAAGLYVVGFDGPTIRQDTSAADETTDDFDGLWP